MKRIAIILFLILIKPVDTFAQSDIDIDYTIFRKHQDLCVQVNLTTYITTDLIEKLEDGLDYVIHTRIELLRPRRIFGAEKKAESNNLLTISYRIVTDDYQVSAIYDDSTKEHTFTSLAAMHHFLADSMYIKVARIPVLDSDQNYYIKIDLEGISASLADYSLPDREREDGRSAIKYLFGQFLKLTGYGRKHYSTRSGEFFITDIPKNLNKN